MTSRMVTSDVGAMRGRDSGSAETGPDEMKVCSPDDARVSSSGWASATAVLAMTTDCSSSAVGSGSEIVASVVITASQASATGSFAATNSSSGIGGGEKVATPMPSYEVVAGVSGA